jgi:long-chain acyl-CoA synthetase
MAARRVLFRGVHRRLGGKLRFLVSGGAPLEPLLVRKWATLGLPIIQGYGATEAAPIISGTTLRDPAPGTVGRAVPGVEIRIADDGEVLVRGPNITPGYWHNLRATAEAFTDDGMYRTGDLGQIDAQGRLSLRGRKKDMIVLANGQKVYAVDVEDALRGTGHLLHAVVVGLPGPSGAQVHAVLLYDQNTSATISPQVTVQLANQRLAAHQQIQNYTVWPEADFPRTHTLKVKKHDIIQSLLGRHEAALQPPDIRAQQVQDAAPVWRLIAQASDKPATSWRLKSTVYRYLGGVMPDQVVAAGQRD